MDFQNLTFLIFFEEKSELEEARHAENEEMKLLFCHHVHHGFYWEYSRSKDRRWKTATENTFQENPRMFKNQGFSWKNEG